MRRRYTGIVSLVLILGMAACGAPPVPSTATLSTTTNTAAPASGTALPSATAMVAAATGAGSAAENVFGTNGPIPIGIAIAITGPVAATGADEANGAKIAEAYFNSHGGVNGRQIRIMVEDTGGDEAGAIRAFTRLITESNVIGVVGPTTSQQTLAAAPIAVKAKTPMISPSANAQGVTQLGEYVSRTSAPVTALVPVALRAALAQKPDAKRVAVFYAQNDTASVSETAVFQNTAKALNLTVVSTQKFVTGDASFAPQVMDAINQRAEIAAISAPLAESCALVQQLRNAGYKGVIVGGDGINTPGVFPTCKAACANVIAAQAYIPDAANSANLTFKFAYLEQFKKDPPQFAAQTFTAVQVFVEALRIVDMKQVLATRTLASIRADLNTQAHIGMYATPLGEITFDMDRDIVQTTFYPVQLKLNPDGISGTFVFLK